MAITDKSNMLCILNILEEYSDEEHILGMKELQSKLKTIYDIKPDRRTIYSSVAALQDFGFDISTYDENGIGYYLREREFEPSEIRLLIDAVYSFEYISKKQTEDLIEKLKNKLSVNQRKSFNYSNIISADKKSPNQQVFLNTVILDEAINKRLQVKFTYLDFDYDKKLVPRRAEKYTVSPYRMICENKHYYLICISKGHTNPGFYRIDMMQDIEITGDSLEYSKQEANLNSVSKVIYAYAGAPQTIKLRGDKVALKYVIESFGKDCIIMKKSDSEFEATFKAPVEGMFYWALQYMQHVEVLEPKDLRKRIISTIKSENMYS